MENGNGKCSEKYLVPAADGFKQGFAYRIFLPHSTGRISFLAAAKNAKRAKSLLPSVSVMSNSVLHFSAFNIHTTPPLPYSASTTPKSNLIAEFFACAVPRYRVDPSYR
jgi:hypothetical protein